MKNLNFLYLFLFFLLFAFEVKAELTFEYHVGVRPAGQPTIIDADGEFIERDLLQVGTGIVFSSDGLKSFTTNRTIHVVNKHKCVSETTLTVPYDFRQPHTQTDRSNVLLNAGETVSYTHLTLPTKA